MPVKKKKKQCTFERGMFPPCRRGLYDKKHCIFHSDDIEGKKERFKNEFWKEFERQGKDDEPFNNFVGFVFPEEISFEGKAFGKLTTFVGAKFVGDACFDGVTFSEDIEFIDANFLGSADFRNTIFHGNAIFRSTTFSEEAVFETANFSREAGFDYVTFSKGAYFRFVTFSEKANFWATIFSWEVDFGLDTFEGEMVFSEATFYSVSTFDDIKFTKNTRLSIINARFEDVSGLFEAFEKYRKILKRTKKQELLPDDVEPLLSPITEGTYPIYSRKVKDDIYLLRYQEKHPKLHFLWWLFADCGRSLSRWALWSLFFTFYFGLNFFLIDYSLTDAFKFSDPLIERSLHSYVYYSVVTFTTLGFGDITPIISIAQKWVMAEVISGYVMLGGLISILANKLARRS